MRGVRLYLPGIVAVCVVAVTAFAASPALATHVQCSDTITASTTLDSNLVDCPGNGILVRREAAAITLDLAGHTVDGSGGGFGIRIVVGSATAPGITIKNGTVRQFFDGITMRGQGLLAENLVVTENSSIGLSIVQASAPVVRDVVAFANGQGINVGTTTGATVVDNEAFGNGGGIGGGSVVDSVIDGNSSHDNGSSGMEFSFSENNQISNNRIADNGTVGIVLRDGIEGNLVTDNRVTHSGTDGIVITGESIGANVVERNRTDFNGDDGIDIDGPGSTLTRNHANHNGDLGIEAVPGTIDGGKNVATANGNPAQCIGVSCK